MTIIDRQAETNGHARARNEHWVCSEPNHCREYPWHAAFDAFEQTVAEEAAVLRRLVRDPDTSCPARASRQQRLAALEWVLDLTDTLRRWDW
jgi:hypothetical protein